jgi:hypothetical protein
MEVRSRDNKIAFAARLLNLQQDTRMSTRNIHAYSGNIHAYSGNIHAYSENMRETASTVKHPTLGLYSVILFLISF